MGTWKNKKYEKHVMKTIGRWNNLDALGDGRQNREDGQRERGYQREGAY